MFIAALFIIIKKKTEPTKMMYMMEKQRVVNPYSGMSFCDLKKKWVIKSKDMEETEVHIAK